jgi:hypothetical protein
LNPIVAVDLPPCLQYLCEDTIEGNSSDNMIKMNSDGSSISDIESNSSNTIDMHSITSSAQESSTMKPVTAVVRTYDGFEFLGALLSSEAACGIADGFLDPSTLMPFDFSEATDQLPSTAEETISNKFIEEEERKNLFITRGNGSKAVNNTIDTNNKNKMVKKSPKKLVHNSFFPPRTLTSSSFSSTSSSSSSSSSSFSLSSSSLSSSSSSSSSTSTLIGVRGDGSSSSNIKSLGHPLFHKNKKTLPGKSSICYDDDVDNDDDDNDDVDNDDDDYDVYF